MNIKSIEEYNIGKNKFGKSVLQTEAGPHLPSLLVMLR
jgi:hypothetical protein